MSEIAISEIFGKTNFDSYSEFHLALALSKCMSSFGIKVDMSDMVVEKEILPDSAIVQLKHLVGKGVIDIGVSLDDCTDSEKEDLPADVDISYFDKIPLYGVKNEEAFWNVNWVEAKYPLEENKKFMYSKKLGYSILNMVAYFITKRLLVLESCKKLRIDINSTMSKSVYAYLNIYSCKKTLPWFNSMIDLKLDFGSNTDIDLDYHLFCNNAFMSKKIKSYTFNEKVSFFEKCGMPVGSILVMFERTGICENNKYGRIKESNIIRLDEIGDDFIGYDKISINKTKEEVLQDYYDIDEDIRYMFSDILSKKPNERNTTMSLSVLGVDEYFCDEQYILMKLDPFEKVFKKVTVDGEVKDIEMSGIDAIYWLLCQYDIEFNKDIFKEMYGIEGREFLWDMYN